MPVDEFESWWQEIVKESGIFDDPRETARQIGERLRELPDERRSRFLEPLTRTLLRERRAFGVVLFLLDETSDRSALFAIGRHLLPFPTLQPDDEEAHLADLIRILAAVDDPELLDGIERYLLEREIGPYWSSVPWALWPHRSELFARAWRRFLREKGTDAGPSNLITRAFLSEPAAIREVRRQLNDSPDCWLALRAAVERQARIVGWLSDEQREALDRSLK